jgi:apolipoprotein N-acyltransferase
MYQCNQCVNKNGLNTCYNQSRYIGGTGEIEAVYNKQNLMPLFEHIPNILKRTFVEKEFHKELLFKKGDSTKLFHNTHAKIIPSLCYDAHDNRLIKKGLNLKGELLIIQSNDRIFKQSHIGLFDTAINIINAISFRIPMVKSSNSGYGVFLSSSGKIVKNSLTPLSQRFTSVHTLELKENFSLYKTYGDWFYLLILLYILYISIYMFFIR